MGECEICGKNCADLIYVNIEGTIFQVCPACSSLGEKITTRKPLTSKRATFSRSQDSGEVLVANYSALISVARQKKGLKQEELANKLGEKLSEIKAIESGKRIPPIPLAKKLEKMLEIKIIEDE